MPMRSERLYSIWHIATQRHLEDAERIQAILTESCRVLGLDVAFVGEVVNEQYRVHYAHDPQRRFGPGTEMLLCDTPCQAVYELRQSRLINDLQANPQTVSMPVSHLLKMQVYVGAPVWVGDRIWGVLAFAGRVPLDEESSKEDITFLELVAAWLGQLLLQKQQRLILEKQALTDQLTGLPNRRSAEQRLRNELAQARRRQHGFTLALCDLDHFKLINDRYGHEVGDEVLTGVANFFQSLLREEDWVARWGGEEFLFFLRTDEPGDGVKIVDRLREQLKGKRLPTRAGPLNVSLSAGVATPGEMEELNSILAEADSCLYEAKRTGRDRVLSGTNIKSTLRMASVLKHAARENRVRVAYQTMVDLQDGFRPVADEALARVKTPDGRTLAGGEFAEAAEGLHLMHEIDLEVSRQVFQRCASRLGDGTQDLDFVHFLNLSPQFLARRNLVDEMLANAMHYCERCSVTLAPIKPVVFAITERQYVHDVDEIIGELQPLLDFGFRLALDDFGSGYSSLLYLAKLPVDFIKIEGWLVREMLDDTKARGLVRSLVAMAREQGIKTIAGSIEAEATAMMLREFGVDWAQGHYFAAPLLDSGFAP
ncbi:MAG TPA: diguanylate cyclase [Thiobacillaceae bacterium]|nr:diguanylate cyclase [Thiobacillaceae bacterium]